VAGGGGVGVGVARARAQITLLVRPNLSSKIFLKFQDVVKRRKAIMTCFIVVKKILIF
jgi:hypothetical protein